MTKRDFFTLVIKLFGLHALVLSIFKIIPNSLSSMLQSGDAFFVAWVAGAILFAGVLCFILLMYADKVVAFLKLDRGFDDDRVDFGALSTWHITAMATFIVGGLLFIDGLPEFFSSLWFFLRGREMGRELSLEEEFWWGVSAVRLVFGYLLVTNYDRVADRLNTKRNRSSQVEG